MLKHFTIIELGADSESPMVGTIDNIPNKPQGVQSFKERLDKALAEHFDCDDITTEELPELFAGSAYDDVKLKVDGNDYTIRIMETWIY